MTSRAAHEALADVPSDIVVRTETTVPVRSTADFERQYVQAAARLAGGTGFIGRTLLRSYSHPTKYVEFSTYKDLAAAWAHGQRGGPAGPERAHGSLAVAVTRHEAYELVHELVAPSPTVVRCQVLIDEVVTKPELAPALEATLRQLFELRRAHAAGFGFNRLLRSAGRVGSFLVVEGYADRAAAGKANTSADVQSFMHDHPAHLYSDAPVSAEAYAVIARAPDLSAATEETT